MSDAEMTRGLEGIRAAMGDTADWTDVVPGDLRDAFPVLIGGDFGATRDVYTRVGGFDISLGGVYEDNDFGVRAHRLGIAVDEAPCGAYRLPWEMGPALPHPTGPTLGLRPCSGCRPLWAERSLAFPQPLGRAGVRSRQRCSHGGRSQTA